MTPTDLAVKAAIEDFEKGTTMNTNEQSEREVFEPMLKQIRRDELIAEIEWCLANGTMGHRTYTALAEARAALATQQAVPSHLENIYGYLCSTAPEGYADEAFRLVPDALLAYSTRHRIAGSRPAVGDVSGAVPEHARPSEGPDGRDGEAVGQQAEQQKGEALPKIASEVRIMLGSATELFDGIGDIVGYQIKTGALHRILGLLSGAGHPVAIAAKNQSVALAASPHGVPPGYVLVPVEPTAEMVEAAYLCTGVAPHRLIRAAKAMIAAAPPSPQPPAAQAVGDDSVKKAIREAYGWLWHVNNEPMAPVPMWSPEQAAYEARKCLRETLTAEERGEAINAVQRLLQNKVNGIGTAKPAQPEGSA